MPTASSSVAEFLLAFDECCQATGSPWYLFGAQAALLYGSARLTADVDITVLLGSVTNDEFVAALEQSQFQLRIDDNAFIRETRVIPVVHAPTRLPGDLVLGGPGLEELFVSRSTRRNVAGAYVPVASPEDLVVMKVLAGRDQDQMDIEAVLRAMSDVDVPLIRETLLMLEEALGQSDLTPLFEAISERARSR